MIDKLYINNKDAFLKWGAFLDENAYDELLLPAPNKPFIKNRSRLENGTRVVEDDVFLDEREFVINFNINANTNSEFLKKYRALIAELNSGTVKMKVVDLNETYYVRVLDFMKLTHINNIGKVNVRFLEPNPANRE